MTLKDYISRIRFDLKDETLPEEYLRQKINHGRRKIAADTRCLECRSSCESEEGVDLYRVPHSEKDDTFVDCIEILDVYYDGTLLEWVNPHEMRYRKQFNNSGLPTHYSYYGATGQPTGLVVLDPMPDQDYKEILIHSIQYPQPLINYGDICELNDVLQEAAICYVEGMIYINKWYPQGHTLLKEAKEEIRRNINLKTL